MVVVVAAAAAAAVAAAVVVVVAVKATREDTARHRGNIQEGDPRSFPRLDPYNIIPRIFQPCFLPYSWLNFDLIGLGKRPQPPKAMLST